jgi:hypothetical protein
MPRRFVPRTILNVFLPTRRVKLAASVGRFISLSQGETFQEFAFRKPGNATSFAIDFATLDCSLTHDRSRRRFHPHDMAGEARHVARTFIN